MNRDEPVPPRRPRRAKASARAADPRIRDARDGLEGPKSLTRDGVRKQKMGVEFLVCDIIRHTETALGGSLLLDNDAALAEHNDLVRRCFQQLDRLSLWAGGLPERRDHSAADDDRGRFIAACNRLYAEIDPGAHAAAVVIWVHNQDGTKVSYATEGDDVAVVRIVHTEDHEGCVEVTMGEGS
jgi:hypothetical protein